MTDEELQTRRLRRSRPGRRRVHSTGSAHDETISMLARTAGEKTQRPFQFSVLQRSTIQ